MGIRVNQDNNSGGVNITPAASVATDDNLIDFIETLEEIDITDPTSAINEYSMPGKDGERILF